MVLRHLIRRPRRTVTSVIGLALAMGLLTGSRGNMDAFDQMIFMLFERAATQDVSVTFIEPRAIGALYELERLPGVMHLEPFRSVAATLKAGPLEKRQGLLAVRPGAEINRLIDSQGNPVAAPPYGVMLSAPLAKTLSVGVGDTLYAKVREGQQPTLALPVTGVVAAFIGTPAYLDLDWLNRQLGEGPRISGAHLSVDSRHTDALYLALKKMPAVAGVELTRDAYVSIRKQIDQTMGRAIWITNLFASLIIVGVIYNSARISLSERGRELASMRVLGFSHTEVSFVLLGELAVLVFLALPLGAASGALLSYLNTQSFSDDLFVLPFTMRAQTIATTLLASVGAAVICGLIVRRRIDRLDLIAVLKTRE